VKGTLVQRLARPWFRGPAFQRGGLIVLDGKRAERYEPMQEPRIGVDLARVRTPSDAVTFVQRYGLLASSAGLLEGDRLPIELSEPFANFERAAEDLREIARTILDVQKAINRDSAALARLRARFGPADPDAIVTVHGEGGASRIRASDWPGFTPDHFAAVDDRTVVSRASDWAAWGLNDGLMQGDARPYVFDPVQLFPDDPASAAGKLRIGILPESLLGFCYLSIADAAASKEPLEACEECQLPFVVDDARQRFCSEKCASRARFRRWKTANDSGSDASGKRAKKKRQHKRSKRRSDTGGKTKSTRRR
jgi:hypothetical protein